jgi:hypothetical protein
VGHPVHGSTDQPDPSGPGLTASWPCSRYGRVDCRYRSSATVLSAPETVATRGAVLTTFETDENVLTALRAGAAGFLVEDTYLSDLLSAVRLGRVGESLLSESWPGE